MQSIFGRNNRARWRPVATSAILDRLLYKSVVLNNRGRSYRLQELEKLMK